MKILLLEDDALLQEIIEEFLLECEYEVSSFFDGEKALDSILETSYDILLLDVHVPNIDGYEILEYLRNIGNSTPVIYITSLAGIENIKKGFLLGADDYLKKPFNLEELKIRIEHVRKTHIIEEEISFDDIVFTPKEHKLVMGENIVSIRQKEAKILEYFIKHKNKIISCDEIIENVWENDTLPTHATIRTYIKNLRKILKKEYIDNIKGEGYRFKST